MASPVSKLHRTMKNIPIGTFHPVGVHGLRALALCAAVLSPLAAFSQINDTEGLWRGTVSCDPQQSASARSPKAFSNPVAVNVSLAALSGKRDNAQVTERFSGSIERAGRVAMEGTGHWKDNPKRAWRYRLEGNLSGTHMTLTGPMESPDGQTRIRDCRVDLTKSATSSPGVTVKSVPATPLASPPEKVNKDKEHAPRQADALRLDAERVKAAKVRDQKAADQNAAEQRASALKRQADEAAAAKANTAEFEALRLKNQQLEAAKLSADKAAADKALAEKAAAEKAAAEKAAVESKKAPIKARSAMDL